MKLLKKLLNSPSLMTWSSMLSRLSLAAFVFPIVLLALDKNAISVWLFLLILNRIRDLFDFGYIDNFSRNYSYLNGKGSKGKIVALLKYSNKVYLRCLLICFAMLNFVGFLWLYLKGFHFNENYNYYLSIAAVAFSGSIYIYGNKYVSFLFGFDRIHEIKRWDTVFTIFNIVSLMVVIYKEPTVLMLTVTNATWVVLTVIRNFFLFRRCVKELSTAKEEKFDYTPIRYNSRREFIASIFSLGYVQAFNLSISLFLPVSISNVYLFLDNVIEQIKNLSRVPFYVRRPRIAREIKQYGTIGYREVSSYMFTSYIVLFSGLFSFLFLGDHILNAIKSNIIFDKNLWFFLSIYAAVERFSSMHNQLNIILSDTVKTHFYIMVTSIISFISVLLFVTIDINYYLYPLTFTIGHLTYYSWHIAKNNYNLLNVSFFNFERNVIILTLLLTVIMLVYHWV